MNQVLKGILPGLMLALALSLDASAAELAKTPSLFAISVAACKQQPLVGNPAPRAVPAGPLRSYPLGFGPPFSPPSPAIPDRIAQQ